MAIHIETRRSDRYVGNGVTKSFAFPFKLLKKADVAVFVSADGISETQLSSSQYSVTLNADQDNNPGGVVVLSTPLQAGKFLVVISAQQYLQPSVFTNLGAFYPSNLNDALDRLTIETQQLLERQERTVTVPVTSSRTPQEVVDEILDVAANAQRYAQQAQQALQQALALKAVIEAQLTEEGSIQSERVSDEGDTQTARVQTEGNTQYTRVHGEGDTQAARVSGVGDQVIAEGNTQVARVQLEGNTQAARVSGVADEVIAEGNTQVSRVQLEGTTQANRVEAMLDWAMTGWGISCTEVCWTAQQDIAEGSTITLPSGMRYIVGHHHLRLSYNGAVLMKPANFEEIGTQDSASTTFKIKFPVRAGDEFMAWAVPLGRGYDIDDVLEQISDLGDAVSDLSAHAVYHDMEG